MHDVVHMSGAGNTFLVMDGRGGITELPPGTVRTLIDQNPRSDGAAIEGVLVLRRITEQHVTADFYNPDGSHGMMCGNGARCIVRFACDHGAPTGEELRLELNGRNYGAYRHADNTVSIVFPPPVEERSFAVGTLDNVDIAAYYVNVNSDHIVIDGPCDCKREVVRILRHHAAFPRGVNVNMVEVDSPTQIHLATFERGVEAVTGACGTGAISACIALWRGGRCTDNITVVPPSNRALRVTLQHTNSNITACTLRGDAEYDNT